MTKGRINIIKILLYSIVFLFSTQNYAETYSLNRQISQYIEDQLEAILLPTDIMSYQIDPTSSELKTPICSHPFTLSTHRPITAGKFSIKASCEAPKIWSRYVRGHVSIDRYVLVARQALPKGMPLSDDHITTKLISLKQLKRGYYTKPEQVINFVLKRTLVKDQILSPQGLTPPLLVKKDDKITIIAGRTDALEVRVSGVALQDGRLNQQIRIKNTSSGKQITARVIGRGIVRVGY